MKYSLIRLVLLAWLVLPGAGLVPAGAQSLDAESRGASAEVTCLIGNAFVVTSDMEVIRSLAAGDRLQPGDLLQVADKSRMELLLPDNSRVRFDAGTVVLLKSFAADVGAGRRAVDINITMGKIWASVSKGLSEEEHFDVSTMTLLSCAQGTIYRMNVNEDQSSVVKVYEGAVKVQSAPPLPADPAGEAETNRSLLPPPAMEEWLHIVQAMQQLVVNADGAATAPARFSCEEDLTDWVRWNRERDQEEGFEGPRIQGVK